MPGTVLGTRDTGEDKVDKIQLPYEAYVPMGKTDIRQQQGQEVEYIDQVKK